MSNNARAVPGGEIGVSQYVQARAARVLPSTDHNPVLLKPRGEGQSQLILEGEAVGHYEPGDYYEDHWADARAAAERAHDRLVTAHDVVVAEGAGSIAEINLHHRDLANLETARFGDAAVLLVADIERGGVFASVLGTLELLPADVRERVAGVLITKFRGDASLLESGIDELESRTGVPVLGVLPHDDPGLPEEDSLALPAPGERTLLGDDDVPDARSVTVGVPRLPRISNFTDLEPLARVPGVRVAYLPLDDPLDDADALVLPGTKNTVDDLLACTQAGLDERVRAFAGPIVGLCGGYQLLGERITNAGVESVGRAGEVVEGFGLLPVETRFSEAKTVDPVTRELWGVGPLAGARGEVRGYEIHMGDSTPVGEIERPFPGRGAATDRVLGTYLHDLFENRLAREAFVDAVYAAAGKPRPEESGSTHSPADAAADLLREHADLSPLGF